VAGATTVWTATVWFYDGLWHHTPEPELALADAAAGAEAGAST